MYSLLSAQRINNNYYHLLVFLDIIKNLILRNIFRPSLYEKRSTLHTLVLFSGSSA